MAKKHFLETDPKVIARFGHPPKQKHGCPAIASLTTSGSGETQKKSTVLADFIAWVVKLTDRYVL